MRFYFDNSALIHLQCSSDRGALEGFLLGNGNILHASAINIAETLAYEDRARCKDRLAMIRGLTRGAKARRFPLGTFDAITDLLRGPL